MPVKVQDQCFRNINGERYVNWCDLIDPQLDAEVEKVKRLGFRHRIFRHPDGFRRLFVREADQDAIYKAR